MGNFRAARLPNDLKGSGWYEILPPPPPARELDEDIAVDWIIVGAGYAGLSAARRLTQLRPGDTIAVIDAQRVGWGAAGRNSGFMIDLPHELKREDYGGGYDHDRRQIRTNRAAIAFAKEAVEEYGLQPWFNPCGKLHAATDGAGLKALTTFEKHLDALDEPYTHLGADDLKRITGTDYYAGGLHAPGCPQIQPAGYVRGFAEGLVRQNGNTVTIYENSPVLRIEQDGAARKVITAKGSGTAPKVIMAVNGRIEEFGLFKNRLLHIYTFASMTRQLTADEIKRLGGEESWGIIPAHAMGSSLRKLKEGRIVVRGIFTYNPSGETDAAQIARMGRQHDKSFRARFPMLKDVGMEHRWGGHLCLTLNGAHAFGELEPGFFSACAQQGLGVARGTLSGMLIAELATGVSEAEQPLLSEMTALGEPPKLYPDPFMTIGAKSHLWWTHKRAGRDL